MDSGAAASRRASDSALSRRGSLYTAVRDGIELPGLPAACHHQLSQAAGPPASRQRGAETGWRQWVPPCLTTYTLTVALTELLIEVKDIINLII